MRLVEEGTPDAVTNTGPSAMGSGTCEEMVYVIRTRKRWVGLAAFVLVLALMAPGAFAGTITGATGLIALATADTLPVGDAEIGVRLNEGSVEATALYGLMDELEIGVNSYDSDGPLGVGFLFKGQLMRESASMPAVAIGFESNQSYIVASKRLTPRARLHAGYLHGDEKGVAAGVAYTLSTASVSTPTTTLLAEYVPSGVNVGARMFFGPSVAVDLALMDLEEFAAGVSMRLAF